jgi:hypothetical protein
MWISARAYSSQANIRIWIVALVIACALLRVGDAMSTEADQLVRVDTIQRLALALYPELRRRSELQVLFGIDSQPTRARLVGYHLIAAIDSPAGITRLNDAAHTPVLVLAFKRDQSGSIVRVTVLSSTFIPLDRVRRLQNLVLEHLTWSDAEFGRALDAAGAKFGLNAAGAVKQRMVEVLASLGSVVEGLALKELHPPRELRDGAYDGEVMWEAVAQRPGDLHQYGIGIDPIAGNVLYFAVREP